LEADNEHDRVAHWVDRLDDISLKASALCCAVIAAMVTIGIIARAYGYALMFSDEYSSYLMAACAFFALPIVTSRREHLVADFLFNWFSPAWQARLRLLADIALLAFILTLFAVAVRVVWVSFEDGLRSQGLMSTPMWVPQSAMLIGLLLASLSAGCQVLAAIRALRQPVSEAT